ncbi:MAG: trigger factor [Candidatus Omnitrophota bacterium]|nr:MAG: trigger factor [Candidatus Omnitrophota bacterium]
MKLKIEDKKNCQKLIKIEVESQKVKNALDEIYKSIGKDAQIPGFRKGKAPRDILQAHYRDKANDEAIRRLIWGVYRDVIKTNDIKPVSYPIIEDVKFNDDGPLNFAIKIDVKPVINLKSYIKIKVKKIPQEVSEEDINKALEAVRESSARFEPVEERPARIGDYVVCDYDCKISGKSIDSQKNAWLHVEENSDLQEITKALIGCSKGQIKEVTMALPKDYKQTEYAGKNGNYKITVNEIKQKILPQLDDELAKQVGEFENLEQLKERLKKELLIKKKQQQRSDMENQLFDFLLKVHQFDVPESTVQRQLQNLVDDAKARMAYQGYKKEEIESQENKLKQTLAINADRHVKIFFLLEAIAEKENIDITDEELNKQIEGMSRVAKQDAEKFRQDVKEKGLTDSIRKQLLHDKVIDFLLENAKIAPFGKTK